MTEQVAEVVQAPIGAVEGRPGVTVVTQENFGEYVNQELGVKPEIEDAEVVNDDPDAVAAKEMAELETKQAEEKAKLTAPKEGDARGAEVFFKGEWVKKNSFEYRLHLKAEEIKKEERTKAETAVAESKTVREQLAAAEKARDELKAKYEPPKSLEVGPEPLPSQFTDIAEYSKALKTWAQDTARKEDSVAQSERQAKEAQEAAVKGWNERQEAIKAEVPDYAEKIANSAVKVSDQMREAIIESEVGPAMLYHFAEHPEIAEALGKMSVRKMLMEFGKLEASLGSADKPQTKSSTAARIAAVAEISKAPAPISPLRGGHSVDGLKIDANGNWTGTPEEFKAARRSGKIK